MRYLIDGYNLLLSPVGSDFRDGARDLEQSRLRLLAELADSSMDPERITIAFDAHRGSAPRGDHRVSRHHGLLILWATGYATADELIADCCRADPDPGSLIVVSDDSAVRKAARRARTQVLPCGQFLRELRTGFLGRSRKAEPTRANPSAVPKTIDSHPSASSDRPKSIGTDSTAAVRTGGPTASSGGSSLDKPSGLGAAETAEWLAAFQQPLEPDDLPPDRAERRLAGHRPPATSEPSPRSASVPGVSKPVRGGPAPGAGGPIKLPRVRAERTFGGPTRQSLPKSGSSRNDSAPQGVSGYPEDQAPPTENRVRTGRIAPLGTGGTLDVTNDQADDFLALFAAEMRASSDRLQANATCEATVPERRRGGHVIPKRDPAPNTKKE